MDKKTQARISKALQQKLARSNAAVNASNVLSGTHSVWAGGKSTVGRDNANGMASSVAFTPLKGNRVKIYASTISDEFLKKRIFLVLQA